MNNSSVSCQQGNTAFSRHMGNAMFLIPTPQVLQNLHTDAFWDANDVLLFKKARKELRQLIRFWDESNGKQKRIVTRLTDSVVDR